MRTPSDRVMTTAQQLISLLKSHVEGDDEQFLTIALQAAASEARRGHGKVAMQLRELVDAARANKDRASGRRKTPVPLAQPRGDLANLVAVRYADVRLSSMVLPTGLEDRLKRVILEQRQKQKLRSHGLTPRRKLLLVGPPGSGKTMTAAALAGELHTPLFTVQLDGLMTKFMGETASKLRLVFSAMAETKGVYFFDEFDAIGAKRAERNDVGEVRRILNSFLQFLEEDDSDGLVVAATNHPELGVGANDGIVSTASLIVGVAASAAGTSEILIAGVAGLVAGAMSMAAGEYVSVSSQADTEQADLARERLELDGQPDLEREELAQLYTRRGVEIDLADGADSRGALVGTAV